MALSSPDQLRDRARQDDALRLALAEASEPAELLRIANAQNIRLSEAEAEQWLTSQQALETALSPEELDALSQGLSDPGATPLSNNELAVAAGGEATASHGEALMGGFGAGEAV